MSRTYRRIYPPPVVDEPQNPADSEWKDLASPFDLSYLAAAVNFESPTFESLPRPAPLMDQLEPFRREFQRSNLLHTAGVILTALVLVFAVLAFLGH
jgi:hypothetical protein